MALREHYGCVYVEPDQRFPQYPASELTNDKVLMGAYKTFENGCNIRIVLEGEDHNRVRIGWGCYGIHVNLCQGYERIICGALERGVGERGKELMYWDVTPETVLWIKTLPPCKHCGNPLFREYKFGESRADPRFMHEAVKARPKTCPVCRGPAHPGAHCKPLEAHDNGPTHRHISEHP